MKRWFIVIAFLLTACSQEISTNFIPEPTQAFDEPAATNTPIPAASPVVETFPPAAPLPAGPISIIAIGDSLTQGDGDDSGLGYPGRLLSLVNQTRPGSTLTNFGRSGWNSEALIQGDQGLLGQLPRAVDEVQIAKAQGKPSVVLVWIGSNDLWYLYEYGGNIGNEQEAQDLETFSMNIRLILSELRKAGAEVIIALLDDQSKRPIALQGEAFLEITPDELERMSVHVERYNEIILQHAAQYGALTVDFYHTDIFTNPATLYYDGNHPNPAGYDLIAQKWYEVLQTILP